MWRIIHSMEGWSTEIGRIIPSVFLSCFLESRSFTAAFCNEVNPIHLWIWPRVANLHSLIRLQALTAVLIYNDDTRVNTIVKEKHVLFGETCTNMHRTTHVKKDKTSIQLDLRRFNKKCGARLLFAWFFAGHTECVRRVLQLITVCYEMLLFYFFLFVFWHVSI